MVNGEKIEFKVFVASKLPQDELEFFNVCMIQGVVENAFSHRSIGGHPHSQCHKPRY
jgi:hypothetical protein